MIKFISDPHLGRNAISHTTPESRKRLDALIRKTLLDQFQEYLMPVVLAGDLFHKSNNSEEVIAQGIEVAKFCSVILAGNHDLTNRENCKSSLQLLADIPEIEDKLVLANTSEVYLQHRLIDGQALTFIPHHTNQALFDRAIELACRDGNGGIVCLHCNIDSGFSEGNNAALNLSKPQIEALLKKYKYIVVGHEHNTRWEYNGRLLVLGNLYPTSFSDISDKYAWVYDPINDVWDKQLTWDKNSNYLEMNILDFLLCKPEHVVGKQFISITGAVRNTEEARALSEAMRQMWDKNPSLLMLRNNTEAEVASIETSDTREIGDSLVEVIDKCVAGTEIESTWADYKGRCHA